MTPSFVRSLLSMTVAATASVSAFADEIKTIEQLTIFGSRNPVNEVPGAAALLSAHELSKFDYTDIMRTLAQVPGVYVMEEDGYGLRPNLGMRGTGLNRSEKITVMEDGVLAAPAAYASPSAYYFPSIGRMQRVEILKGTSSIKYGPRTTGGVLNMTSRSIPDQALSGQIKVQQGQDGFGKFHAFAGGSSQHLGGVLEVFQYQADGFKQLNGGGNSGFDKKDILGKFRISSLENKDWHQQLEVKLKSSDETSNETYLGLIADDFVSSPFMRYSASQKDKMTTEHNQVQLNYLLDLKNGASLEVVSYYNDFHRNWYKVSKIGGKSLGKGAEELASAFDHNPDSLGELAIDLKANNREYLAKGLQTQFLWELDEHYLSFGARYHKDEMDRYQWVDKFYLDLDQQMSLYEKGEPGSDSNRIDSASALSFFVHDQYSWDNLTISAGLRYEDMTLSRDDWGKTDLKREQAPSEKENNLKVLLPALGLTYKLNHNLVLLTGIQRGFAPPAPGNTQGEAEKSWNLEAGIRFGNKQTSAEVVAFYSDYQNMHGNCTASQGCDESKIDNQYNAGEVDVTGLEANLGYRIQAFNVSFPMNLAYTYTNTSFKNSFASSFETWGNVEKGDALPYLPQHQLQLNLGIEYDQLNINLAGRYLGAMRTTAGQGWIGEEHIASRTVWDLSARFALDKHILSLNIDNVLNRTYVATRVHGGIMAGKPRAAMLGYQYQF